MWGPNDAIYFWDRWTGRKRNHVIKSITEEKLNEMKGFFDAVENYSGLPLVNKSNHLITFANIVADKLPNSVFIYVERDPVYLAQSHLLARRFMHGDETIAYGTSFGDEDNMEDPIASICHQIHQYDRVKEEQQKLIGTDRFQVISYEKFCRQPVETLDQISKKFLGEPISKEIKSISVKNKNHIRLDEKTFSKIKSSFQLILSET